MQRLLVRRKIGKHTGDADLVLHLLALPLALVMASGYTLERAAPVLCISNEDSYQRCAAVIRPYTSA